MGGAQPVIDLHTHTTASDGTDTLAELTEKAIGLGLECLAVTDHDTLLEEPAHEIVLRGIEMSARGSVHILGYFFGAPKPGFGEWLSAMRARRRSRNAEIVDRLQRLGLDVTLADAEALGPNVTCRPHFARLLLQRGYVQTWDEAFEKYLGERAPAYVERNDAEPEQVLEKLRAAGAVSSLAHPVRLRLGDEDAYVMRLANAGLCAIEAYHSDHSVEDRQRYLSIASKFGLGVTGGSDYHGANKPAVKLGSSAVPPALLDDLRRRAAHL